MFVMKEDGRKMSKVVEEEKLQLKLRFEWEMLKTPNNPRKLCRVSMRNYFHHHKEMVSHSPKC